MLVSRGAVLRPARHALPQASAARGTRWRVVVRDIHKEVDWLSVNSGEQRGRTACHAVRHRSALEGKVSCPAPNSHPLRLRRPLAVHCRRLRTEGVRATATKLVLAICEHWLLCGLA